MMRDANLHLIMIYTTGVLAGSGGHCDYSRLC